MPDQPQQSSGFTGTLKSKWGPLPVWGWLALVTVILLGWWLYQQRKGGQQQTPTPASVGQPGVVVVNQGGPDIDSERDRDGKDRDRKKGREPPEPPESRAIKVSKDETLGQLARQRHWSDATLRQVEEMNLTAGSGEWTPSTKLEEGQTVIRPLKG